MHFVAVALIALVALLHAYFLVLEMFLWTKPTGLRVFAQSAEKAEATKVLAQNQGLYNGFLSAGLVWSLVDGVHGYAAGLFFLGCVVVAGVFGAATVSKRILFIQALPAAAAMSALVLSHI
jgi:putative membrane protein